MDFKFTDDFSDNTLTQYLSDKNSINLRHFGLILMGISWFI
jgi:hypothetical protein